MVQKLRYFLPGCAILLAMIGCQQETSKTTDPDSAPPAADVVAATDAAADAGHADASDDAQTFRVIMQGLGVDMQGFAHALFTEDSAQMVARAGAIADHPHALASEVERIKGILGTEMPAFEEADERVHEGAERLHDLAKTGRLDEVAQQLGQVQRDCVACHSQFRERLRTDRP